MLTPIWIMRWITTSTPTTTEGAAYTIIAVLNLGMLMAMVLATLILRWESSRTQRPQSTYERIIVIGEIVIFLVIALTIAFSGLLFFFVMRSMEDGNTLTTWRAAGLAVGFIANGGLALANACITCRWLWRK